jgi:hypothetical protein
MIDTASFICTNNALSSAVRGGNTENGAFYYRIHNPTTFRSNGIQT